MLPTGKTLHSSIVRTSASTSPTEKKTPLELPNTLPSSIVKASSDTPRKLIAETPEEPIKSAAWFPEALKSGLKNFAWRPAALVGGLVMGVIGLPVAAVGGIIMATGFQDKQYTDRKAKERAWRKEMLTDIKDAMEEEQKTFGNIAKEKRMKFVGLLQSSNTKSQGRVQLREFIRLNKVFKNDVETVDNKYQLTYLQRKIERFRDKLPPMNRAMYLVLPLYAAAGMIEKAFE